jgi:mono/diheme cytochrome c family protein
MRTLLLLLAAALALAVPASAENGKALFGRYCASCHGPSGEGSIQGQRYGGSQARNQAVQVGMGPSLVGVGTLAADF